MLYSSTTPSAKRAAFRAALRGGELLRFPGAFNPLSAKLVQRHGFEGVYVSGAVLAADLGLPDVGLTTATEVAGRSAQIARVTDHLARRAYLAPWTVDPPVGPARLRAFAAGAVGRKGEA